MDLYIKLHPTRILLRLHNQKCKLAVLLSETPDRAFILPECDLHKEGWDSRADAENNQQKACCFFHMLVETCRTLDFGMDPSYLHGSVLGVQRRVLTM